MGYFHPINYFCLKLEQFYSQHCQSSQAPRLLRLPVDNLMHKGTCTRLVCVSFCCYELGTVVATGDAGSGNKLWWAQSHKN